MNKINSWIIVTIAIALLPLFYLGLVWNQLPPTVALHFGSDLQPDRYGPKSSLWWSTGLLAVIGLASYFLLNHIWVIDRKIKPDSSLNRFSKIGFIVVVFLTLINFLILITAKSGAVQLIRFLPLVLGVFIAILGNYMINIRPNYFVGFRLPWTLSDDKNWRKTHQVAGKLWFVGGLLFAVVSLFLPQPVAMKVFTYTIVVLALIPTVYSYNQYRQH